MPTLLAGLGTDLDVGERRNIKGVLPRPTACFRDILAMNLVPFLTLIFSPFSFIFSKG